MKLEQFIPVGVFLAVSIPVVWILNALDFGGEQRVWVAIGVGALATGYAMSRLSAKQQKNGE